MDPVLEFDIRVPPHGSRVRLRALHAQLRAAIVDGRLKPGLRLPSTRALARSLAVSRNAVVAAYELLLGEGYVVTRAGSGCYVCDVVRVPPARATTKREPAAAASPPAGRAPDLPRIAADFRLGVPDESCIRFDIWRRLAGRALRVMARQPTGYALSEGQPALREAIAHHVSFTRAMSCSADDVLVTAGAQQAFDLLARALVTHGKTVVAVENPGYPPAWAAFAAAGAKLVPVRVDREGLVVDELPPQTRIVYVTPSHQFPLGSVLSARRRAALLEFARAHRAVIVEDDYDGEFRYGGPPHDALKTIDRSDCVFFVGTFSKSLFPALRLGYVLPPPWAQAQLIERKKNADWHCNVLVQDTLAAFIGEGHLTRHIRKVRKVYAQHRSLVLDALQAHCADWLEPVPGTSGLHLAALATRRLDIEQLIENARHAGVGVYSLKQYTLGRRAPAGLLFGYGAIDGATIDAGMKRLQRVLSASGSSSRTPAR
jgi:GntR family transcriptional regulator / MocR family aminotransferase